MKSIQQAVNTIIERSPFMEEFLVDGLANMTALARHIQDEVEELCMKPAGKAAIVMALKRYQKKQHTSPLLQPQKPQIDVSIRHSVSLFTFEYSRNFIETHMKLLKSIHSDSSSTFLQVSYGLQSISCITQSKYQHIVEKATSAHNCRDIRENVSAIILSFNEKTIDTAGVYYRILKPLAWENIRFIEIISVAQELTIVFDSDQAEKALQTILRLVKSS